MSISMMRVWAAAVLASGVLLMGVLVFGAVAGWAGSPLPSVVIPLPVATASSTARAVPSGPAVGKDGLGADGVWQLIATILAGGGGAAGAAAALWKWWLKQLIEARRKREGEEDLDRAAMKEGAELVKALLPALVENVAELKATQQAHIELTSDAVVRADAGGKVEWVNKAWRRLTGQEESEAEGTGWLRGVHPEDRERVRRAWLESIGEEQLFDELLRLQDGHGIVTYVRGFGTMLHGKGGKVTAWLALFSDVDQEEHDDARRRQEWRTSSPDPSKGVITPPTRTPSGKTN